MAISIKPPPKPNTGKWYKAVAEAYMPIDLPDMDVKGRSSVRKRVKAHGIDEVVRVINFYRSWLQEQQWRVEQYSYKGVNWFMAFKFDEVNKIMISRKDKEVVYQKIKDNEEYVDPFRN